jgi:hypothetical protein
MHASQRAIHRDHIKNLQTNTTARIAFFLLHMLDHLLSIQYFDDTNSGRF